MTRTEFAARAGERVILLDGAYGAEFFRLGLSGPAEELNLTRPGTVLSLQKAYVAAGSDAILTNTFTANRLKLREYGMEDKLEEINRRGVAIALEAASSAGGSRVLVFGDLTSTGTLSAPFGAARMDDLIGVFEEQSGILADAGVDCIILETITDIKELKAAIWGTRKAAPRIPLIVQMAFDVSGRTVTGTSLEIFAAVAADLDVDMIGINCGLEPEGMVPLFETLAASTDLPLSVEPNAGKPFYDGLTATYHLAPEVFASYAEDFRDAGASLIGGCCGTGPEHIRALRAILGTGRVVKRRVRDRPQLLASRTTAVAADRFLIVGERINPAGKPDFQAEIAGGRLDTLIREAGAQQEEGAHVVDLNLGIEKLLVPDACRNAILELDRVSSPPLSLDLQSREILETALKEYPGRALLNSSTCDPASLEAKAGLLAKYGGMLILLAMGRKIPESAEGRLAEVDRAVAWLEAAGIAKARVFVDPLVLAFGAGKDPAVTLDVMEGCAKRGLKTICGLSNISFGMADRSGINAAFLSRSVERGLSGAIMNPGDPVARAVLKGSLLLDRSATAEFPAIEKAGDPVVEALLRGKRDDLMRLIDASLAELPPLEASQSVLGRAMGEIGSLYERGKYFLPQLLFAADTAFPVFDYLNAKAGASAAGKALILLATVEGDIHDIGKKIIGTVMKADGYEVVDLGKDVPVRGLVDEILRLEPDIVGLSAMMTTTVGRIEEAAKALASEGLRVPIIAGGASMNRELATRFGVSFAANGSECLAVCKTLIGSRKTRSAG